LGCQKEEKALELFQFEVSSSANALIVKIFPQSEQ